MSLSVSQLFTYPLKSGRALSHQSVFVNWRGLQNDRLWMVVDAGTGQLISQRPIADHEPTLALVTAHIDHAGDLMIEAPLMGSLRVLDPNRGLNQQMRDVTMHGKPLKGLDAGDEAAAYLSTHLKRDVRLVRFPDKLTRQVDQKYGRDFDHTAYADGFPILVASEESHAALQVASGIDRFRAGIILKGAKPFEEDSISVLQIGGVILHLQKPCTRCPMPSVNQLTGRYEKEGSPLPALNKMRKGEGDGLKGLFFGVNASPTVIGTINVGDSAHVIARHEVMHPAIANMPLSYRI